MLGILVMLWAGVMPLRADYRLTGFYGGSNASAMVYLFALENGKFADTLASCAVLQGRFELYGKFEGKRLCCLWIEDEHRKTRIDSVCFELQDAGYLAYVGTGDHSFVTRDTKEEKIAAAFFRNECHFVDRKKELVKQYVTGTEMEKDSLARLFENLITDYEQEESRIVRENPDSRAAACAVSAGVSMYTYKFKQFLYSLGSKVNSAVEEQKGWAALLERYAMLGDAQKAWLASTDFQKRLTAVKSKMELARLVLETSAGKEAPDMLLTEKGGKEIRLRQIPGKLRIVDFWASWCGPCRKSNPFMLALYEEFKDKGLEVVSVSVDVDEDAWLKAVKEDKLTWKYNVRDLKGQAGSLYGITAIPCVLLLDDNNQILGRNLPKDELRRIVEERLK